MKRVQFLSFMVATLFLFGTISARTTVDNNAGPPGLYQQLVIQIMDITKINEEIASYQKVTQVSKHEFNCQCSQCSNPATFTVALHEDIYQLNKRFTDKKVNKPVAQYQGRLLSYYREIANPPNSQV